MVTYGFYNSVDHDRTYDAMQVSELFDGLIREGVYEFIGERFMVRALSGFQVSVGTGRAWYKHTWTKNDATLVLTLPAPPTLPDRYRSDAIVLDINSDIKVRENKITYIKGEESADSNPPHPTLASGTHHQVPLAYIKRVGREEEILQTNINYVVGQSPCPFVVSVIEQIDITDQVAQWNNAWDEWFSNKQGIVETDISNFESVVSSATTEVNNDKAAFKAYVTEQVSEFTIWMSDKKEGFDTWFANLQYILDGDVAGHLQNEIEALANRVTPIKNGGTGNPDGYIRSGFKQYKNYRAEIDITSPGLFATSEGMNTAAAGEGSHAEGGGNYTYSYQDEHLECDELLYTDGNSVYAEAYIEPYWPSSTNVQGLANENVHCTNWYEPSGQFFLNRHPTEEEKANEHTWGYEWRHRIVKSLWVAIELVDNTNDTVLKREIACIGQNVILNPKYIGIPDSYIHMTDCSDAGLFTADYIDRNDRGRATGCKRNAGSSLDIPYSYWYIDGATPEESSVLVNGNFLIWIDELSSNGYSYANIALCRSGFYDSFGDDKTTDPSIPDEDIILWCGDCNNAKDGLTIKAGNTNNYSLNIYYSYSTEVGEDHPINLIPAGEQLVVNGKGCIANGKFSHAEGFSTFASGDYSHAEGRGDTTKININEGPGAFGQASHVEGIHTIASGSGSHAEGYETEARGNSGSHAEGSYSIASNNSSHAEGTGTLASGGSSHAEGMHTNAIGFASHAGGQYVSAYDDGQFVHGYTADPRNNLLSADNRLLYPTIFGIGGKPRWILESTSEITPATFDEANGIANKNRNGFSVVLKCGTSTNSITYKTLMPNDTFGTFLELVDLIAGDPVKKNLGNSGRIVKLSPNGSVSNCSLTSVATLFDNHTGASSILNAITIGAGSIIVIGETTGNYPVVSISNPNSDMVSDSNKNVYIKYTLIRIM